jgi:glycosyltransferase 2 family protein
VKQNGGAAINRTLWRWARLVCGAAILAVLVARVGAGPFVDALRVTSVWALVAGTAVAALTTVCGAWRWCLVARGLGVELTLRSAVAAYYRSQLLNATLPGGVVGDVHRGVRHGRKVGAVGRGVRSVAWERSLGQVVQIALTVVVLLVLPSPVHPAAAVVAVVAVVIALVVVVRRGSRQGSAGSDQGRGAAWPARLRRVMTGDLRGILRGRQASWGIALTSLAALLGHAVVFLLAVQATGASLPADQLVPLTLIVLAASAVPTNIAGWGPREGVAAWAFAAYGLTAAQGVTTAAVFGVLVLVGTLPGVVVLLRDLLARHSAGAATRDAPQMAGAPVTYRDRSGVGDGGGTEGDRRLAGIGRG